MSVTESQQLKLHSVKKETPCWCVRETHSPGCPPESSHRAPGLPRRYEFKATSGIAPALCREGQRVPQRGEKGPGPPWALVQACGTLPRPTAGTSWAGYGGRLKVLEAQMNRVVSPASICCLCCIPRKPSQDVRQIVRDKPTMGCKGGVTYVCLGGGDKGYECKL